MKKRCLPLRMHLIRLLLAATAWTAAPFAAHAAPVTFEGFPDSYTLTNEIFGLQFSDGTVLTAGVGLNDIDFPPTSGVNVLAGLSGILSIAFDAPVDEASGYFTYASALRFVGTDLGGMLLFDSMTPGTSNLGGADLFVFSATGLQTLLITSSDGSGFTLDDLTVAAGTIPEPQTLPLAAFALVLLAAARRVYPSE